MTWTSTQIIQPAEKYAVDVNEPAFIGTSNHYNTPLPHATTKIWSIQVPLAMHFEGSLIQHQYNHKMHMIQSIWSHLIYLQNPTTATSKDLE